MFITFEGVEGSGKSTIITMLNEFLTILKVSFITTKEPGSITNKIKDLIKENRSAFTPMVIALLYAADSRLNFDKVIYPAIESNRVVMCERSIDSSIVYQSVINEIPFSQVVSLQKIVTNHTAPDLTVIIDVPSHIAYKRLQNMNPDNSTHIVMQTLDEMNYHEKIRLAYLDIKKSFTERDIIVVDGTRNINLVFQEVRDYILEHHKFPLNRL